MNTQIPIYRAKKIDSDERVIGFYVFSNLDRDTHLIRIDETYWEDSGLVYSEVEIDPSTLAIHFPNTIDSEGNKIFASLSEDGKGGDILKGENDNGLVKIEKGLLIIECRGSKRPFNFESGMGWEWNNAKNYKGFKVIGIKQ